VKKTSLGLALVTLLIMQACGGSSGRPGFNEEDQNPGTSVETISIAQEDISRQVRSFGTVQAQDVVQVTPQVSNRITEIYADLGDTVSQGQRLARIYDATLQEQVQESQAQLEQSQAAFQRDSAQFARQEQLMDRDLISRAELDNAQATFQNSKAQLQSARAVLAQNRENLQNTTIRSPVYGVVLTRNVAQGDLASTGQAAFEIGNLTGFETRVYLPLDEWQSIKVGQKVTFSLSNRQESSAAGRVARISPRLDPTTGLGEVVIAFTDKGTSIYQGVLVESVINVETRAGAVVIPRSALVENVQTLIEPESNTIQIDRSYSAFVVQNDSLALKRELTLGIEQGDKVEVTDGLQAGDEIVVTGQSSLEDSSKVRIAEDSNFQDRSVPIGNGGGGNGEVDETEAGGQEGSGAADSSSANANTN
jgi:RND family efflux transporter MFP subunit